MPQPTASQTTVSTLTNRRLVWGWVMLGSIVTWFVHLNLMYFLVQPVCRLGGNWTFHATSLVLLGITLLTGLLGWQMWSSARDGDDDVASRRFAGAFGAIAAGMAGLAIVAQWIPVFVIGPCQ